MSLDKIEKKYIPMTETMFYILLSLRNERHGYAIKQHVSNITDGRMDIGAGTMYQSLGKLSKDGQIRMTQETERQKRYIITEAGSYILKLEAKRIAQLYKNVEDLL
jgi:DNA-binding PadR family transcriptional regulator